MTTLKNKNSIHQKTPLRELKGKSQSARKYWGYLKLTESSNYIKNAYISTKDRKSHRKMDQKTTLNIYFTNGIQIAKRHMRDAQTLLVIKQIQFNIMFVLGKN